MKEPELEEKTFIEFEEPKTNKRNILSDIVFHIFFIVFIIFTFPFLAILGSVLFLIDIALFLRKIFLFLRNRKK
nr:hypothetical protein [uncultured Pseudogulbenkiania sp.]